MTPQEQMKAQLEALPLPRREVQVYGRQIVITCHSEQAARKWGGVLAKFATVKGYTKAFEPNKEQHGTRLIERHEEHRVFARI
jgi:hypothetical protein